MKIMRRVGAAKYFFLIAVVFWVLGAGSVYSGREEHGFTLYKSERSPYVLFYPVRLKGPGEIRVLVNIINADVTMQKPVSVSIIQKLPRKNRVHAVEMYEPGKRAVQLNHTVDSIELAQGADYQIALTNFSKRKNVAGKILIVYPGKHGGVEGARPAYPDLTITGLRLNDQKMLQVEIVNKGPGRIPLISYERNVPSLYIFRNGKGWGGAGLNIIDPRRQLHEVNGKVVYTTALKITGYEKIRVVIDYNNSLQESNEGNNGFQGELSGKDHHGRKDRHDRKDDKGPENNRIGTHNQIGNSHNAPLPDLAVLSVSPTSGSYLQVEVVNNGPGKLAAAYWKRNVPILAVYRAGKEWGKVTLNKLDPGMKLAAPGGKVVFVDYGVRAVQTESVRVVIDPENVVPESNERNNEKMGTISYRR